VIGGCAGVSVAPGASVAARGGASSSGTGCAVRSTSSDAAGCAGMVKLSVP
jgi:hypothetical protein